MLSVFSIRIRSLCAALLLLVVLLLPNVVIGADKCGSLDRGVE
jgi:hypothetical protein